MTTATKTKLFAALPAMAMMTALVAFAPSAHAAGETVEVSTTVTKTVTEEKPVLQTGARVVNFMDFDINKNGVLSTAEVGEMLFRLYDTDGNEVIDNIEFERKAVLTIIPTEKETITTYDFNNDGIADETHYTFEAFAKETQLTRFDENKNGLSASEFSGKTFMSMDIDKSKAIELQEWRGVYVAEIAAKNARARGINK